MSIREKISLKILPTPNFWMVMCISVDFSFYMYILLLLFLSEDSCACIYVLYKQLHLKAKTNSLFKVDIAKVV